MNTPNKLTILRVIMIPLFMLCFLSHSFFMSHIVSPILFVLAFITDWLDGYIARKNNEVTNFGKIMDPLADKILVAAAMVCLNFTGVVSPWVTVIILAREFIVSGIRMAAAAEGNVVAASKAGKAKTMWQFIAITLALFVQNKVFVIDLFMIINVILTIVSGVDYIVKNKQYLSYK